MAGDTERGTDAMRAVTSAATVLLIAVRQDGDAKPAKYERACGAQRGEARRSARLISRVCPSARARKQASKQTRLTETNASPRSAMVSQWVLLYVGRGGGAGTYPAGPRRESLHLRPESQKQMILVYVRWCGNSMRDHHDIHAHLSQCAPY